MYQTVSNLSDSEESIFEYILNNPGPTVNKVCTEMKGIASPLTVRRKIKKMLKDGSLEDRKTGNSFHSLYVSDKTEFNRINKELENIDVILTMMIEPLQKIAQLQRLGGPALFSSAKYMQELVPPYFNSVFTMLWKLLELSTVDKAFAQPDSLKLGTKIIGLIGKTTNQPFYQMDHKKILGIQKDLLIKFKQYLVEPGIDQSVANPLMIENLIQRIEKFQSRFLN